MRVGNPDGHFGFRAAAENYWSGAVVAGWLTAGAILLWLVARRMNATPHTLWL